MLVILIVIVVIVVAARVVAVAFRATWSYTLTDFCVRFCGP